MGILSGHTQQEYYGYEKGYGSYQFTSLDDIITQFQVAYVGEDKIISKIKRADVAFHAQRAMQELSFDTFKSIKSQEIKVPETLQMILPQDYVNYTKISRVDSAGIKHPLYSINITSNPTKPQQEADGDFLFDLDGNLIPSGNLLSGETLQGGVGNWEVNISAKDGSATAGVVILGPELATSNGWVWDNNKLTLFNGDETSSGVPNGTSGIFYTAIRQVGVPIYSGETYTLTFTLSNYVAGSYKWHITDENGALFVGTAVTADGTYTQTIEMSASNTYFPNNVWDPQIVAFRNDNSGSGGDSVTIDNISIVRDGNSETSATWSSYKSATPSENNTDDYTDDTYWPIAGERYGLDPQHAQVNGSFYIDQQSGKIHFSSNISGKTVVLDYISDGVAKDADMIVHKFAEEAMYKSIAYAILSTRANVPPSQVNRLRREKFAAVRTAKLRLSNIKLEELTQILRGKSKHIKH